MMSTEYAVITLPGNGNYAITLPGQITFLEEATQEELESSVLEILNDYIPEEGVISEQRASLAVIPTFDCNLRCIYCYAKGGESKEIIQLESVQKALEYKKSLLPDVELLDLYLVGGGEPLLYFDLVKDIYKLAQNYFSKVEIHVVTNGTFRGEVSEWLISVDANVRVSYDGVAQSDQRPYENGQVSTSDVENTVRFLVERGLDPILQMIVTSKSIHSMIENAHKAVELGVEVIKFEPALSTQVSRGTESFEPNPVLYGKRLLEVIQYIAINRLPLKIDTGFFTKPANGFYCGMAKGNFTLTPEGLVTPCVEVARSGDPFMERIGLGSVQEEKFVLSSRNSSFLSTLHYKNQKGGCKDCSLRMLCLGGCPMANLWRNGLPLKKSAYTCSVEHVLLPDLLLMIARNPIIMEIVMENIDMVEGR